MGARALFFLLSYSAPPSKPATRTWLMGRAARSLKQHYSVIAGVNRRQLNKIVCISIRIAI
jgi:hypothetical protein